MEQKQMIGPGEAAAMLDVSTEYLRLDRLRPEGPTIGYVKLPSGRVRYRRSEIERVLAACTVEAVEPAVEEASVASAGRGFTVTRPAGMADEDWAKYQREIRAEAYTLRVRAEADAAGVPRIEPADSHLMDNPAMRALHRVKP